MATLPSYTVLPILVTTPPMIVASTFVVIVTTRPVAAARRCCSCAARSGESGRRGRDFRAQHVAMLHQSLAVHVEEIRKQRQPATRREQQHQLAGGRRRLEAIQNLLHDRALVGGRHDRVRQRALQIGMLPHEIDERRELLLGAFGIGFLDGDVEQRFGVPRCGGPHAHDVF